MHQGVSRNAARSKMPQPPVSYSKRNFIREVHPNRLTISENEANEAKNQFYIQNSVLDHPTRIIRSSALFSAQQIILKFFCLVVKKRIYLSDSC